GAADGPRRHRRPPGSDRGDGQPQLHPPAPAGRDRPARPAPGGNPRPRRARRTGLGPALTPDPLPRGAPVHATTRLAVRAYLSLVERYVRDVAGAGSNPGSPTNRSTRKAGPAPACRVPGPAAATGDRPRGPRVRKLLHPTG